jgi:hypothetical protein
MYRHRDLQACPSGSFAPVDYLGDPQILLLLEPDAIRHPALLTESKCHLHWARSRGRVDT